MKRLDEKQGVRGFTLIELLIVIALISLLSSLAIPNLVASRMAANETATIGTLKRISQAQETFKIRNLGSDLGYATLAELESSKLFLWKTAGTYQRNGYTYANIVTAPTTTDWGVSAFPTGAAGVRDFAVTSDGFIRYRATTGVAITTSAAAQALNVIP